MLLDQRTAPELIELVQEHSQVYNLSGCQDLGEAIQQATDSNFSPYRPPECHIHEVIAEYLSRV